MADRTNTANLIINHTHMETTQPRVQLNASLRYSPSGELVSRDLLINFREESVDECVKLLGDFNKQFNINLGLAEQPQIANQATIGPADAPSNCPRCLVPLIKRTVNNPESTSYKKVFLGCGNFTKKGCLYSYWL